MAASPSPFLTAEWRHLAMLNFEIEPSVLQPLVPAGTELDDWNGRTLASVVGFLFLNTRVLGAAIPFHRNFEEVNLRFYVRRKGPDGWRRAVVFVKELVPRAAIAWVARALYGENYVALPMGHQIETRNGGAETVREVSYRWRLNGRDNQIRVAVQGEARAIESGSEEEFITEHYWGYTRRRDGGTLEYRVEHPRWQVWTTKDAQLDCDVAALYGERFVEYLGGAPYSAFLAEGSEVTVFKGLPLVQEGSSTRE